MFQYHKKNCYIYYKCNSFFYQNFNVNIITNDNIANNIPLIVNTGPAAGLFFFFLVATWIITPIAIHTAEGINSININVISNDPIYTPFKRALLS